MVHSTRRGGRRLPAAPADYEHLDPFAAELAFELVTVFRTRYQTSSDFLREHMADPGAPDCIAGHPDDRKAFDGAKRAMSRRVGRSAREIPEWDLVEFVLTRCGLDDDTRTERLAGLWQASQRYGPPGYRGPVRPAHGAPPPYVELSEAPSDKVRVEMLLSQLSREQDNSRHREEEAVREVHESSLKFYRELTDLRAEREHWRECEKELIRIIYCLQKAGTSTGEEDLHATVTRQAGELQELNAAYSRERADHNLTANRLAFVAACLDAVSAGGGTDPVLWLRDADFPLGADLYGLLNQPVTARTRTEPEAVARFLTVYLRTYLISWFGDASDRDDTVGPYREIVRNGMLPPVEVLQNVLEQHSITLQVAQPLMAELTPEDDRGGGTRELPDGPGDVHTLEVLGGEHRTSVLDKPVNVVDLIQNLTRRPMDTA